MYPLSLCITLLTFCSAFAQSSDNFVLIPGGEYPFGKDNDTITLDAFYISPTEVSYAQMAVYALDNGIPPETFHDKSWGDPIADRVAINVNWFDAIKYANWLSEQQGYTPVYQIFMQAEAEDGSSAWKAINPSDTAYWANEASRPLYWDSLYWDRSANGYRLPTEAEWEYAASGYVLLGAVQKYAGTDRLDSLVDYARYGENSNLANAVASRKPNRLGLYDMSGNAWEWCFDVYEDNPVDVWTSSANPVNFKYENLRISYPCMRGGGWGNYGFNCQVRYRSDYDPWNRDGDNGFRLLRTP